MNVKRRKGIRYAVMNLEREREREREIERERETARERETERDGEKNFNSGHKMQSLPIRS